MRTSIHPHWLGSIASSLLLAAQATPAPVSRPASPPALNSAAGKPATIPALNSVAGKPALSSAECAVWDRERSFAQSVEAHDAVAFAEHIREAAVFEAGTPVPPRG